MWQGVLSHKNLTTSEKSQLENLMASTDWTNALKAQETMDTMFRMGIDAETIEAYYKAATAGVESYIKSQEEAI